jgi:EAL domain-containing protein (putative c-di-GMP-specific phosphodiesterase class I)
MRALDGSGGEAETVVKTIIALGRELKMRVTVEGIETAEQVSFLEGASGDQAQGFYFGRPVPSGEIAAQILADFRETNAEPPAKPERKLRIVD